MSNKIAVWGLVIVLTVVASLYYFFYMMQPALSDPMKAIPGNVAIVAQFEKPKDFFYKVRQDNEIWNTLKNGTYASSLINQIEYIDSISANDPTFPEMNPGQFIISVHFDTTFNEAYTLYTLELKGSSKNDFINTINKYYQAKPSEHYPSVFHFTSLDESVNYFTGIRKNILFISKQDWLVNRAIHQNGNDKTHFTNQDTFIKLLETAGKNTDARLFFNYQLVSRIVNRSVNKSSSYFFGDLGSLAEWTEMDLIIKKNEILLSGFTIPARNNYLTNYANQSPGNVNAFELAPFNTNILYALNINKLNDIIEDDVIANLSKSINFDVNKLLNTAGNELTYFSNATNPAMIETNSWFVLHSKNTQKAIRHLDLISKNTGVTKGSRYGNQIIRKINHKSFIPELFGPTFSTFKNTWYSSIDDYIIFANSPEAIRALYQNYESGKTLDLNESFKQFNNNLAANSNILLYFKPTFLSDLVNHYFNESTSKKIKSNNALLTDFSGVAIQFTSNDSIFYTNIYLRNDKQAKRESPDLWRVELDYEVFAKPYLVKDHRSGNYNVIVFDKASNIYLITADGQIAWKKKLDDIPESGIYQIDYYKNNKIQYLFNTRDFIYLLDKNGNNVEGFPKKINPSATNGLSLFDYDKDKNYRILLAQADKRVYNYTETGKKVTGWLRPKTDNIVTEPIIHLTSGGLDYIMITDINNNISIVNRRGNERIKLQQRVDKARHSTYYINKTNSKGIILTSDKYGRLTYISKTGVIKHTEFGEFSADHFFLYEDFTGNGANDFIYVEGNQLNVFDRFKNVKFNYSFSSTIKIKPVFFMLGNNQRVLGIVDKAEKAIYLFDKSGTPLISSGLIGENPFTVGSLFNDNNVNLITSSDKTVFNYRIR